jgi:hypothetical protein
MNNLPIWLRYALIYFGISLVLALIGIYVGKIPMSIQFILGIGILVLLCRMMFVEIRANNNSEYLSYGEAFLPIFLMVSTGIFMSTLVYSAWINFIDPNAKEIVIEQGIESAKSMMSMFGVSEDQAAEAMESQEDKMAGNFGFGGMIIGAIWSSPLIGAITAAIFAFFFRKEEKFDNRY